VALFRMLPGRPDDACPGGRPDCAGDFRSNGAVHHDEGVANRSTPIQARFPSRASASVDRGSHMPAIEPR